VDHVAICVAILLWLVRPQDWLNGFAGVGFMKYAMLVAILGLWARSRQMNWKLFQAPADFAVTSYLIWIVLATGEYVDTAKEVLPFAVFYFATALSQDTSRRLRQFLNCWVAGLCVVTVFALSTHFGGEFAAGSADLTEYFDGRLALNTWIFNNPNSLGHGVVALIPLAYVWLWWRRPWMMKLLAAGVIYVAGYCVFLTQSKGAYLCGAAAFGVVLMFRKRLVVQVFLVALAMTAGVAALKLLPRMDTMSASEDGIAGRLVIWQMAHNAMVNTNTGEGWKKFEAWVTIPKQGVVRKATHGSYVNVGADLGYPGLFLFLAVLYCGVRTVLQARPPPEDAEAGRLQRALLSLVASYGASAWMIDRAYHTDFFFIAGAVAAFHRLMSVPVRQEERRNEGDAGEASVLVPVPALAMAAHGGGASAMGELRLAMISASGNGSPSGMSGHGPGAPAGPGYSWSGTWLSWSRIGVIDVLLIYILFELVLYTWVEIMTHFISF
jgi:hypothetical protein